MPTEGLNLQGVGRVVACLCLCLFSKGSCGVKASSAPHLLQHLGPQPPAWEPDFEATE